MHAGNTRTVEAITPLLPDQFCSKYGGRFASSLTLNELGRSSSQSQLLLQWKPLHHPFPIQIPLLAGTKQSIFKVYASSQPNSTEKSAKPRPPFDWSVKPPRARPQKPGRFLAFIPSRFEALK